MKKILIAILAVIALSLAFAVPAFADQPDNPGCYGERVSDQTPAGDDIDPGDNTRADRVHASIEKNKAEGSNLGQSIKTKAHVSCGIPPKHTP